MRIRLDGWVAVLAVPTHAAPANAEEAHYVRMTESRQQPRLSHHCLLRVHNSESSSVITTQNIIFVNLNEC